MRDAGERLVDLIPKLRGRRVMVVGDLVVDHYVYGEPQRLSREAPVVVTRYEREEFLPGGAANAVRNLLALGAQVLPVGVVGKGASGQGLLEILARHGAECRAVVVAEGFRTVTKTRYLVGEQQRTKQQVFRMDTEPDGPLLESVRRRLLAQIQEGLSWAEAVLLSDYGYGVVDEGLLEIVLEEGAVPLITADSRYRIASFKGVGLATPNLGELEAVAGKPLRKEGELEEAGRALLEALQAPGLLVTRGKGGMSLFRRAKPRLDIPAIGVEEVTDVSGAGDTVIAVATLALTAGATLCEAARLANLAAGVVVTKVGPATCSQEELASAGRRFL